MTSLIIYKDLRNAFTEIKISIRYASLLIIILYNLAKIEKLYIWRLNLLLCKYLSEKF